MNTVRFHRIISLGMVCLLGLSAMMYMPFGIPGDDTLTRQEKNRLKMVDNLNTTTELPESYGGYSTSPLGNLDIYMTDDYKKDAKAIEFVQQYVMGGANIRPTEYSRSFIDDLVNRINTADPNITGVSKAESALGWGSWMILIDYVNEGFPEEETFLKMFPEGKDLYAWDLEEIDLDIEVLEYDSVASADAVIFILSLDKVRALSLDKEWFEKLQKQYDMPKTVYATPAMFKQDCYVKIDGCKEVFTDVDGVCELRQTDDAAAEEFKRNASVKSYKAKTIYVSKREKDQKSQSFLWRENDINFLLKFDDIDSAKNPLSQCEIASYNIIPRKGKLTRDYSVYPARSEKNIKFGTLPKGTLVDIWEEYHQWLRVEANDMTGYIKPIPR